MYFLRYFCLIAFNLIIDQTVSIKNERATDRVHVRFGIVILCSCGMPPRHGNVSVSQVPAIVITNNRQQNPPLQSLSPLQKTLLNTLVSSCGCQTFVQLRLKRLSWQSKCGEKWRGRWGIIYSGREREGEVHLKCAWEPAGHLWKQPQINCNFGATVTAGERGC